MNFRVGQKVVCIKRGSWEIVTQRVPSFPRPLPEYGGIYVIERIRSDEKGAWLDLVGFHWDSFDATRFRPLVERKTDISIFTAMLTEPPRELVTDDEFHTSLPRP